MKKILFVVDDRVMGGVSVVLEDILNNINLKDKKVDLLILTKKGDHLKNIPKNINIIYGTKFFKIINLSISEVFKTRNIFEIIKKLYLIFLLHTGLIKFKIKKERKKILKETYDVEIAFKYGFTTLFVFYGNTKKKINWIHCDCKYNDPAIKYRLLFKKILPLFQLNILLSKANLKSFQDIYNCHNTKVINNLVSIDKIINKVKNVSYQNGSTLRFISVGRFSLEKGYDQLIEAFHLLNQENLLENVELNLYGEGNKKDDLEKLICTYHLEEKIFLNPKTDNPYQYIKTSDLYILSSYNEGYPLVIIESLLCGTPVLTTNIASAEEMINHNYGMVVDISVKGLYNGLRKIILDRNIIITYRNNLKEFKYDNHYIISQIEEVLK